MAGGFPFVAHLVELINAKIPACFNKQSTFIFIRNAHKTSNMKAFKFGPFFEKKTVKPLQ